MPLPDSSYAAACLSETVGYVQRSLQASAAIFCWINGDGAIDVAHVSGVAPDLLPEYFGGMHVYDPLDIYALVQRGDRTVLLETEKARSPADHFRVYSEFLHRYEVFDEVDFVFRQDGRPLAVMAALKRQEERPFCHLDQQWDAMHRYLEFTLQQHPRARKRHVEIALQTRHAFTARELEVAELLQIGASNARISEIMGIGVPTVKTHVVHIFDKLGVESRAAAVAYVAAL